MPRITVRLLVALGTFLVGVFSAAVWVVWLTPDPRLESPPVIEAREPIIASRCFPGRSRKVDSLNRAPGSYFPRDAFSYDSKLTEGFGHWYARELQQQDEPILVNEGGNLSYRFLWLRSFHPTIAIRVSLDDGKKMLFVKRLSNRNDKPARLMVSQARSLKPEEWATFVQRLNESCFWEMPASSDEPLSEDGAQWVFEGVREGFYHVTHRQSPNSSSYRELCLYMLQLSGLPLDETKGEIY